MIHSLAQTAFVACSITPTQPQARQDAPLPESPPPSHPPPQAYIAPTLPTSRRDGPFFPSGQAFVPWDGRFSLWDGASSHGTHYSICRPRVPSSSGLPLPRSPMRRQDRFFSRRTASSICERPPMLKEERHYVRTMVEISAGISHRHSIMVAQPSRGVSPEDHPEVCAQKLKTPAPWK